MRYKHNAADEHIICDERITRRVNTVHNTRHTRTIERHMHNGRVRSKSSAECWLSLALYTYLLVQLAPTTYVLTCPSLFTSPFVYLSFSLSSLLITSSSIPSLSSIFFFFFK